MTLPLAVSQAAPLPAAVAAAAYRPSWLNDRAVTGLSKVRSRAGIGAPLPASVVEWPRRCTQWPCTDCWEDMVAIGRRYSGDFLAGLQPAPGPPLPRIAHFEIWNEPNLDFFFRPHAIEVDVRR